MPQVKLIEPGGESDDSSVDQENKDELELAEASSWSRDKGTFRKVIGQATWAMREQLLRSDCDDCEAEES
jgi:hypothetical protein